MSYYEANQILDACRRGADFYPATINEALTLTGDLDHVPFSLAAALERA